MGLGGREERRQGLAARPSPLVRIGQGEGGGAPLPSSLPPLSPSQVLIQLGKGGVLLPVGVGHLPARLFPWPAAPPVTPLYTGAGGTPKTQQLII